MEQRRITLGNAMVSIAVIMLVMALIVQTRRAVEREARYQAEIARLWKLVSPDWLDIANHNQSITHNCHQ